MTSRRLFKKLCSLALGCAVLAGLAPRAVAEQRANTPYWTPLNATEGGIAIDQILIFIFWLTLGVFLLTQIVFVFYLVRYRRKPGVKAHYTHGNNTLEIIWTSLPTVIFLGLAIWGDNVWHRLTQTPAPADAITIEVVGYQFAWDLRYGGEDGKLDETALEKISVNNRFGLTRSDPEMTDDFSSTDLVIPIGKPVHIVLRSRDVIHSFYVPEFRLYQDAVPGRTIDWMWFKTIRTGDFQLACSQLCGSGHYNMKAPIKVVSQADYDAWHTAKVKARGEQLAALALERQARVAATK